jgi:hypothetical protein
VPPLLIDPSGLNIFTLTASRQSGEGNLLAHRPHEWQGLVPLGLLVLKPIGFFSHAAGSAQESHHIDQMRRQRGRPLEMEGIAVRPPPPSPLPVRPAVQAVALLGVRLCFASWRFATLPCLPATTGIGPRVRRRRASWPMTLSSRHLGIWPCQACTLVQMTALYNPGGYPSGSRHGVGGPCSCDAPETDNVVMKSVGLPKHTDP